MTTNLTPITDWHDLAKRLNTLQDHGPFVCRGEPETYPSVVPKVDRPGSLKTLSIAERLRFELDTMSSFGRDALVHLPGAEAHFLQDAMTRLMIMQHYGAPTRLLDWTRSIWIGAFFAAAGSLGKDGRVLYFNYQSLEENVGKKFGTETPLAAGSQSRDPNLSTLFDEPTAQRLHEWVVCLYSPTLSFPRLTVQQGLFTVASKPGLDHWKLATQLSEDCGEIKIAADAKPGVLRGLARMGITAAALFPGVDGIGRHLQLRAEYWNIETAVLPRQKTSLTARDVGL